MKATIQVIKVFTLEVPPEHHHDAQDWVSKLQTTTIERDGNLQSAETDYPEILVEVHDEDAEPPGMTKSPAAESDERQFSITLDQDWYESERGGVLLSREEDWNAWLQVQGDIRLEISLRPGNYPTLSVTLVEITDDELFEHLAAVFDESWFVLKLNLTGRGVPDLRERWREKGE